MVVWCGIVVAVIGVGSSVMVGGIGVGLALVVGIGVGSSVVVGTGVGLAVVLGWRWALALGRVQ